MPVTVHVPVPCLVKVVPTPVPLITPEKAVLVLSPPVVKIPVPIVTKPVPATDPTLSLKLFKSNLPSELIVTAEVLLISAPWRSRTTALPAAPTLSPMIRAPCPVAAAPLMSNCTVPSFTVKFPVKVLLPAPFSNHVPVPVLVTPPVVPVMLPV